MGRRRIFDHLARSGESGSARRDGCGRCGRSAGSGARRAARHLVLLGTAAAMVASGIGAAPLAAQSRDEPPAPPWDVTRPRGKARLISFTTDEGTWLSPDVSPDGRRFLFQIAGENPGADVNARARLEELAFADAVDGQRGQPCRVDLHEPEVARAVAVVPDRFWVER